MPTTPPPRRRRRSRRLKQFNVPIDPEMTRLVTAVCALLRCNRRQLLRASLDALLGRRSPLTPAELALLDGMLHAWQEAARHKTRRPADA